MDLLCPDGDVYVHATIHVPGILWQHQGDRHKELTSQLRKLNSGFIRGINQLYHTAHHLQVDGLIKRWKAYRGLTDGASWEMCFEADAVVERCFPSHSALVH